MEIIPAIDLINGKCVRLKQGDYSDQKIYSDDPVAIAKQFENDGADMIHIVDLDGAKSGSQQNFAVISDIVKNISIPVEVGGGIRNEITVQELLAIGVYRVILGTIALENIDFVKEMIRKFGAIKIVVGIDAHKGFVAIHGWREVTDIKAVDFIKTLEKVGVQTVIYTDIATDGMLKGPNVKEIKNIIKNFHGDVVASGGVSNIKDIERLNKINAQGVIIGKAIYEGRINLKKI